MAQDNVGDSHSGSPGREVLWRRPWDEETSGFVVGPSGPKAQYASLCLWLGSQAAHTVASKTCSTRDSYGDSSDLDWVFTPMRDALLLSSCLLSQQSRTELRLRARFH